MQRRHALSLLALPLLAACAGGEDADRRIGGYAVGFGDRIHAAALRAPWEFGDLSRWRGQPGRAALAVADLEILTDGLARDPYWSPETPPDVAALLGQARAAVRARLGIGGDASPAVVVAALTQAAEMLESGRAPRAAPALERPGFGLPGLGTLERLSTLPALRETETAANAAAAEIGRRAGGDG